MLVDTWAATAAEAFEGYLVRVTDSGIFTMTRWHTGPRSETARPLILAAAALETNGVATGSERKHILYATSKHTGLGTMIMRRSAWSLCRKTTNSTAYHLSTGRAPYRWLPSIGVREVHALGYA